MDSWKIAVISTLIFQLGACTKASKAHEKIQPAQVEKSAPDEPAVVTLTVAARNRLGIESRVYPLNAKGRQVLPISALIYDTAGGSWVFVEPEPLKFRRARIEVLETAGGTISVASQARADWPVVSQGAAELNGTESGVGK